MMLFLKLLQLLRPVLPTILLSLLVAFLCMASSIGLMASAAYLISSAALHPMLYELSLAIVAVRFFGIARAVFRYAERYISHDATFRILTKLRIFCYDRMEKIAPAKLVNYKQGELFSMLIDEIDTLKDFYLRVLAPPLTALIILFFMDIVLAYYSPWSAAILTISFITIGLLLPYGVNYANKKTAKQLSQVKSTYKSECLDIIYGLTELTAFHYSKQKLASISVVYHQVANYQRQIFHGTALVEAGAGLLANLALLFILALLIPLVRSGQITGIHLAVLALSIQSAFEPALVLPVVWQYCAAGLTSAKKLFAITEQTVELPTTSFIENKKVAHTMLHADNLHFSYQTGRPVLKDINFSIALGEKIAIVGPSGSGKTTLFNLILRLWQQSSGMLYLQGTAYAQYTPEEIREKIHVITQNTYIFHGSIADNFRILYPDITEKEITLALEKAQLKAFIETLPLGIDTNIGENGKLLSGGQRQRLAIARAIAKPSPILLLDEPTAGLDAITAQSLLQTIQQASEKQTLLFITHDLRGLDKMDRILVLKNGTIIEQGTFAELVALNKEFKKMLDYQQFF